MNPIVRQYKIDKDRLLKQNVGQSRKIARAVRSAAIGAYIGAYIGSGDVAAAIMDGLANTEPLFLDAMVEAHLAGRLRAMINGAEVMNRMRMQAAISFTEKRLLLTPKQIDFIKNRYSDTATNVTRGMKSAVEAKAKKAVNEIVSQGMTVRDGTTYLRDSMDHIGLNPASPWLLETLVRTQISLAYGAGRWNANQDPDIAEILWGYEYVTVGDDRVRPEHEAMEGVSYPKDHPFWDENWPPNDFNCRCDVLEIFNDETNRMELKPAPGSIETEDGEIVGVGADEDWAYNAGQVFQDMLAVE